MKILVVDDDFVSLNIMTGAVEKLGHQCISAEDGEQGWELFQKEPCEVVLSDWMMPGMTGLELCRLVRGFHSQDYCYFIMLSSLDKKHHVLEGLKAGADDYLTKPLDLEDLEGRLLSASRVTSLHRKFLQAQSQAVLNSKLAAVGQLAARPQLYWRGHFAIDGASEFGVAARRQDERPHIRRDGHDGAGAAARGPAAH